MTSQNWRLYAGAALIVWAAGLQVDSVIMLGNSIFQLLNFTVAGQHVTYAVQYSMWNLQKRPEFKEKIEKPALERSLQDEPEPKEKTQWSVRTRF